MTQTFSELQSFETLKSAIEFKKVCKQLVCKQLLKEPIKPIYVFFVFFNHKL